MVMPFDFALAVGLPLHAYFGLNGVISDYVPKATQKLARGSVAGITAIAVLGLLKLSFHGPGMIYTIKSLWSEKK